MFLSGINFTLLLLMFNGKIKKFIHDAELKFYFWCVSFFTIFIAVWLHQTSSMEIEEAFRKSLFQVISLQTSTGFATADYMLWPSILWGCLVIVMIIGACAGSTGGGIKVSRVLILFKAIRKELSMMIHPRMVKKIKMDGHNLSHETLRSTNVYMTAYFIVLFVSLLIVCLDEYDLSTNFTAVLATLNNIGPGLELVGPTQNFALFSPLSKCVLMFDMLAGRLELFPMLVILLPSCWKKY